MDANVLFAVLVKEGKTEELLFRDDLHLYAPDFIFQEFSKYEAELLEKTNRRPEGFRRMLEILKRRITMMPAEDIAPFLEAAEGVSPDPNDAPYFALALKLGAGIWSNDGRLQNQAAVRVWKTHELARRATV